MKLTILYEAVNASAPKIESWSDDVIEIDGHLYEDLETAVNDIVTNPANWLFSKDAKVLTITNGDGRDLTVEYMLEECEGMADGEDCGCGDWDETANKMVLGPDGHSRYEYFYYAYRTITRKRDKYLFR